MTTVVGLYLSGVASVTVGTWIIYGSGRALIVLGVFVLALSVAAFFRKTIP